MSDIRETNPPNILSPPSNPRSRLEFGAHGKTLWLSEITSLKGWDGYSRSRCSRESEAEPLKRGQN